MNGTIMETNGRIIAAIATALHLYLEENVHDKESGIITIRRRDTLWADKRMNFRKSPKK